jgi:two-component system response regulator AlgR
MRILLADDERRVRSALRVILNNHLDLNVVGEAEDVDQALTLATAHHPDLVLLDWELAGGGGAAALAGLRAVQPNLAVIALSGRPESQAAAQAAAVDAFVSKGDPPERLLAALTSVATPVQCS